MVLNLDGFYYVPFRQDNFCTCFRQARFGRVSGKLDLGVFVKDILAGGPADVSGDVHPGDRIIAINGHSLEGLAHYQAVELIRQSKSKVTPLSKPIQIPRLYMYCV